MRCSTFDIHVMTHNPKSQNNGIKKEKKRWFFKFSFFFLFLSWWGKRGAARSVPTRRWPNSPCWYHFSNKTKNPTNARSKTHPLPPQLGQTPWRTHRFITTLFVLIVRTNERTGPPSCLKTRSSINIRRICGFCFLNFVFFFLVSLPVTSSAEVVCVREWTLRMSVGSQQNTTKAYY